MSNGAKSEELKRRAAIRAAEWIREDMVVGLGTGSTVRFLLEEIAHRRARGELSRIVGIPTSRATEMRCGELQIPLGTLADHPDVALSIDGADEVDPGLDAIKGLGGALLREKIVASASATYILIVDSSKRVTRLGSQAPVPVEVDPFGHTTHPRFFASLGARAELRREPDGSPFVTDGGNYIYHCRFPEAIEDARALEAELNGRAGVVENGLFVGFADHVVVATDSDVEVVSRPQPGGVR